MPSALASRPLPWWPSGLLLAAAAALAGCSQGQAQQTSQGEPRTVEVGVVTLVPQAVALKTELAGRTVATRSAEIRPQVGGIVRERLFQEDSFVRAGQPLYQLDPASHEAALDSAEAGVARAQAALNAAELKARRQQELLAADAGSRQEHEAAEAELLKARADLKTAQAALANARIELSRTRITAPIAGRVDTSSVTPGALVTANQAAALTTVQQLDPISVDIPQSSVELLKLRRQLASGALQDGELSIRLKLEDGSAYAHEGRLQVRGVAVNPSTGAVTLRAQLPNPEGLLLPGMYVRAVLAQAQDPAAILVPQAGISRNPRGEATALVVGSDGIVQRRAVTVADVVNGQWRVTQGLAAGERLIVEGGGKVREGQAVRAVTAGSPPGGKPSEAAGGAGAPGATGRPVASR
ncbi:efflux RND transporter periplasmic adaptor subunit [Caldimonas tepidiphila]|uniref:efflux RND transporter periplasmic adaptor subunit n=1 Tax=Caldimonas tepidiphila TaxID=2315841 RepID=UPI001F0CCE1D|nr:efflux RND transporter periplasmic adaptor subunit [Caldimonas tepidiphila]